MTLQHFRIVFFLFCTLLIVQIQGQEMLTGLQINQALQKNNSTETKNIQQEKVALTLPFLDDFSTTRVRPDQAKWIDSDVFINKDYAIVPTNTGVATFDVLDDLGQIYSTASALPFVADYLTSNTIRLDSVFEPQAKKLNVSDSVYLSFFFQPQGRGDKPEHLDSLVLQLGYPTGNMVLDYIDSITFPVDFYLIEYSIDTIFPLDTVFSPASCTEGIYMISNRLYTWGDDITLPCDSVFKEEISWHPVWAVDGISYADFVQETGKSFQQVLIPITNPLFFTSLFQFRFFNYGSIANDVSASARGNVDFWNIDFVYLNYGRSINDIYYEKVSFSERAPSFLRRYESMPYNQYRAAPTNAIKPEIELKITNLSNDTKNTRYQYVVDQVDGTQEFGWDGGNCNLSPYSTNGFQTCATGCGAKHACPPIVSLFALDFDIDTTSFITRHFISDSSGTNILVDSLVYRQGFYNYFAYDDGTPELGYGIEPAGGLIAIQYSLSVNDTLKGIQILFNQTLNNANNDYFDLIIWKDNNGLPGNIIYTKTNLRPIRSEELYGFHMYELDEPLAISGTFYIGIRQIESGSINIGFDAVNNAKEYLFYNSDGIWRNSLFDGSLMIRPVFGTNVLIGIDETENEQPQFTFYPNPASSTIHFQNNAADNFNPSNISLYDLTGRAVLVVPYNESIDISTLPIGFYILRIESKESSNFTSKILITNK